MKSGLRELTVCMAAIACASTVNAQAATLYFEPSYATVGTNGTAAVALKINTNGLSVSGCSGQIAYAAPLTYSSAVMDNVVWNFLQTMNEWTPGTLSFSCAANSSANGTALLIGTITFATGAPGTSILDLQEGGTVPQGLEVLCLDGSGNPLTTTVQDGGITVAAPTPTPPPTSTHTRTHTAPVVHTPTRTITGTPTRTRTSTPTVPHVPCAGDCDADGVVEGPEQVTCVNILAGSQQLVDCPACDANGDQVVDVVDMTTITRNIGLGCQAQIQDGWAVNPSNDGKPAIAYNEFICQSLPTKPCLRLPILGASPPTAAEGNAWAEARNGGLVWCVRFAGSDYCTPMIP